jgi:hypothetical protein
VLILLLAEDVHHLFDESLNGVNLPARRRGDLMRNKSGN